MESSEAAGASGSAFLERGSMGLVKSEGSVSRDRFPWPVKRAPIFLGILGASRRNSDSNDFLTVAESLEFRLCPASANSQGKRWPEDLWTEEEIEVTKLKNKKLQSEKLETEKLPNSTDKENSSEIEVDVVDQNSNRGIVKIWNRFQNHWKIEGSDTEDYFWSLATNHSGWLNRLGGM